MEEERRTGNCPHGTFYLDEGCPQCIAERKAAAQETTNIVKVQYWSDSKGEPAGREYSFFAVDPLAVGDFVQVPTDYGAAKARVTAVNVPEAEIAAFRDRVKTIPSGSIRPEPEIPTTEVELPTAENPPVAQVASLFDHGQAEVLEEPPPHIQIPDDNEVAEQMFEEHSQGKAVISIAPKSDAAVLALYQEGVKLLKYAQSRIISTNEDLKPATDDLGIIAKTKKALEELRGNYVGPIRGHLNTVNDAFKELLFPFEEADQITRGKVKEFRQIEQDKFALAQREAAAKGGEITVPLQEAVPDRTRTAQATTGFQKVHKWELVDKSQVPLEYLIVDAAKVTAVVRAAKGDITIPGIRVYTDQAVRVNTN